jgi:hypothetical protein
MQVIETGFDRISEFSEFRYGKHPVLHHSSLDRETMLVKESVPSVKSVVEMRGVRMPIG